MYYPASGKLESSNMYAIPNNIPLTRPPKWPAISTLGSLSKNDNKMVGITKKKTISRFLSILGKHAIKNTNSKPTRAKIAAEAPTDI